MFTAAPEVVVYKIAESAESERKSGVSPLYNDRGLDTFSSPFAII